jgi:hypothetical protein
MVLKNECRCCTECVCPKVPIIHSIGDHIERPSDTIRAASFSVSCIVSDSYPHSRRGTAVLMLSSEMRCIFRTLTPCSTSKSSCHPPRSNHSPCLWGRSYQQQGHIQKQRNSDIPYGQYSYLLLAQYGFSSSLGHFLYWKGGYPHLPLLGFFNWPGGHWHSFPAPLYTSPLSLQPGVFGSDSVGMAETLATMAKPTARRL